MRHRAHQIIRFNFDGTKMHWFRSVLFLYQAVIFQGQSVSTGAICSKALGDNCESGWRFVCDTCSDGENLSKVTCHCRCDFEAEVAISSLQLPLPAPCSPQPLISGQEFNIPDAQLTASSQYTTASLSPDVAAPWNSRLGQCPLNLDLACCWQPSSTSGIIGEYIQADLGRTFEISAVAIQGRGVDQWGHDQWVTKFKLAVSEDDITFFSLDNNGQGYEGAHDGNTVVTQDIPPTRARYVRLVVMAYHGHASVRWELYGCPAQ